MVTVSVTLLIIFYNLYQTLPKTQFRIFISIFIKQTRRSITLKDGFILEWNIDWFIKGYRPVQFVFGEYGEPTRSRLQPLRSPQKMGLKRPILTRPQRQSIPL